MSDILLTVHSSDGIKKIKAPVGALLNETLGQNGYSVPAFCGGLGTCNKCTVKVLSGLFSEPADENGKVRSCRARLVTDSEISLDFADGTGLTYFDGSESIRHGISGVAVDIGTTTVAASAVYNDGSTVSCSALNPQIAYGADVVTRIEACQNGKLNILCSLIRDCVSGLIASLCMDCEFDEAVISGNTVMTHIFCGISPAGMGVYPFTPAFTQTLHYKGTDIGLPVKAVTVLPTVSAFIGSDVLCGIYSLLLQKGDKRLFLADLGTNGELVIFDKGRLLCTSAPAGPALEGACMECGTGGIKGAINRVYIENEEIKYTTIDDAAPVGICSSGIIDAVAILLKKGLIDETGLMKFERYYITDNVYISQSDIRQLQLAKSAVCSGIEVLCESAGISTAELDTFYISGGLGYYTDTKNAMLCGILPKLSCHVLSAGNTSLAGALMCLGNPAAVDEMQQAAKKCTYIDLGTNSSFGDKFMGNMCFK